MPRGKLDAQDVKAVRETPEKVWSHVQAHFKGPIGGKNYFHVMIDQLSRWLEVKVVWIRIKTVHARTPEVKWVGGTFYGSISQI